MSVNTDASENLDAARESVDKAIKALSMIVVNQCWGHDQYTDAFNRSLRESMGRLMDIRDSIS